MPRDVKGISMRGKTQLRKVPPARAAGDAARLAVRHVIEKYGLTSGTVVERDRYLTCKVRSAPLGRAFLKLSKLPGPQLLLENQIAFDRQARVALKRVGSELRVPKHLRKGSYKGYRYFISEDVQGRALLESPSPSPLLSSDDCRALAAVHRDFLLLPPFELPLDSTLRRARTENRLWIEHLVGTLRRSKSFRSPGFAKIFRLAKIGHTQVARFPRYGDLLPWHVHRRRDGTIFLVDSELACSHSIKWADVAWCATALAVDAGQLEAARAFVAELRNLLPKRQRASFDATARYAFAQRCVYALVTARVPERNPVRMRAARAFVKAVESEMFCRM